jgi:2-polyprenyl-3-methyl-5-hydroxy-6-metoxy-1,4-benzoquinol methylase
MGAHAMTDEMRRRRWDEHHAGGDFEGHGPNESLQGAVAMLRPGTALELAAGGGTNAIWLASHGWRVTAVDWSSVALANARTGAAAAGVEIDWLERDLFTWTPPARKFDLVVIVYLHLAPTERRTVYLAAAEAVAPGGHLVVIGHDRSNLADGAGPIEAERLLSAPEAARELVESDRDLAIERAEVVRRAETSPAGSLDALIVIRRTAAR